MGKHGEQRAPRKRAYGLAVILKSERQGQQQSLQVLSPSLQLSRNTEKRNLPFLRRKARNRGTVVVEWLLTEVSVEEHS